MPALAKTPAQVIAGEATYNGDTWNDMLNIASVIANRAMALNVTPAQVVASKQEFHAYMKGLPAGADVELAERALDDVMTNGPVNTATFYSMPSDIDYLPSTKEFEVAVEGGHMYFNEPTNKSIKTSVGYREPTNIAAARAAYAQRQQYELAQIDESQSMPTPNARPDILQMTQNPALLAGQPLAQVDPNIAFGVSDTARMLANPALAEAQSLQAPTAALNQDAVAFDASRMDDDPSATISSPASLAAALSRMNTPAANPFDISQAMNDAIASTVASSAASKTGRLPGVAQTMDDPSRMADEAPMSDASRAVQDMMKEAASGKVYDRFGPAVAPARAFDNLATAGIEPGISDAIAATGVPARSVTTQSITPDNQMINSPEALAAALGSFPSGMMAQRSVAPQTAKTGQLTGNVQQTADPGRLAPTDLSAAIQAAIDSSVAGSQPSLNGFAEMAKAGPMGAMNAQPSFDMTGNPMQAAIDAAKRGPVPSSFSMTNNPMQAAIDGAAKAPAPVATGLGINSPEHQALQAQVEKQLAEMQTSSDLANASGVPMAFEREIAPMQQAVKTPTVEGWSAMAEAAPVSATESAMTTTDRLPSTEEAAASQRTERLSLASVPAVTQATPQQQAAGYQQAAQSFASAGMLNIGQQPPTNLSGELPTNFNVLGTTQAQVNPTAVAEDPAPALETVTVPNLPSIASPVDQPVVAPAIAPAGVTNAQSLPAVQQRQSSAMDVWGGKAQTGVATDGSTVSRLSDGKIGRYVPEYDHTLFSNDEGASWSSPVKGNALTQALAAAAAPQAQPVGRINPLASLLGLLSGFSSPTGVAPVGSIGGMSVGRDGPAGAPSGYGPGGLGATDAGGYGSTGGIDPTDTQ